MKRCITISSGQILADVLLLATATGCATDTALNENVIALFDGQTLRGWNKVGDAKWKAEDGELTIVEASGSGVLVTKKQYSNFKLTVEFWVEERVNSGIFVRCNNMQEITPLNCYEINIWDKHPKPEFRTASIVMKMFPPLAHVDTVEKVSAIASKWGFHYAGNFARIYSEIFNETPVQTLRQSRAN